MFYFLQPHRAARSCLYVTALKIPEDILLFSPGKTLPVLSAISPTMGFFDRYHYPGYFPRRFLHLSPFLDASPTSSILTECVDVRSLDSVNLER